MEKQISKKLYWANNRFHSFRLFALLLCLLPTNWIYAQEVNVTGTVVDKSDQPIIGATVAVKNTTIGTITDINGEFSLNAVNHSILLVTYIGYIPVEVKVDSRTKMLIKLQEDVKSLDEVVVVGFSTQKKVNLTGAVSTVNSKTLQDRPVTNIVQALQGTITGLNVSNDQGGGVGLAPTINVRGLTTIGQGSSGSPLILIDGMEGDINTLNPQDVDNISILKDAASSSIYGSRAPFGVILITTKKGKTGKPTITYDGNVRSNSPINLPNMADSYTFALFYNEMQTNSGQPVFFSEEWLQRIKDFRDGTLPKHTYNGKEYPMTTLPKVGDPTQWEAGYAAGNDNVDVFKAIYKPNSLSQEHNITLSGGTESVTYYLSGNYLGAPGLMKLGGDEQDRIGVTGKISAKVSSKISASYIGKFIRSRWEQPSSGKGRWEYRVAAQAWPILPIYDPNGYLFDSPSPYLEIVQAGRESNVNDKLYQQFNLTIEPITGWKIIGDYNFNLTENLHHLDRQKLYLHDIAGNPILADGNSYVDESYNRSNYHNFDIFSEYSKEISGHSFKVLAGFQGELLQYGTLGGRSYGILLTQDPTINTTSSLDNYGKAVPQTISGGLANWATAGYFGRLNYDYKGRYLVELNLRYDGTSRFRADQRWNWLPSASFGWNIAREAFWKNLEKYVGTFKLRGSYGILGNQNTSDFYPTYSVLPVSPSAGGWLVGGTKPNVSSYATLVSASRTWEKVKTYDGGVDLGLLNNRLTASFDYYVRYTNGMIGPVDELPAIYGVGTGELPRTNNTDLKTKGFELDLSWVDHLSNGLNYNVHFTLSDWQTTILKYSNPSGLIGYNNYYEGSIYYDKYNAGETWGNIWGYTTAGLAKTKEEMDAHLATLSNGGQTAFLTGQESNWGAGDIMYKDLNGDGKIDGGANTFDDPGDRSIIGNITPRFTFGLNLGADWKGFDFRAFFQGIMKRDYFNNAYMFWGTGRSMWEMTVLDEHLNYFRDDPNHPLGLNTDAYYPKPTTPEIWDYPMGKNHQVQTRYLQNAAYIRLKNLTLGYTIPQAIMSKISVLKFRIYVAGENIWTGTRLTKIFDPETIDNPTNASYPLYRTYSAGVNITF